MFAIKTQSKTHRNIAFASLIKHQGIPSLTIGSGQPRTSPRPNASVRQDFHEILGFERFKRRGQVRLPVETLRKTYLGRLEKHQEKTIFLWNLFFGCLQHSDAIVSEQKSLQIASHRCIYYRKPLLNQLKIQRFMDFSVMREFPNP